MSIDKKCCILCTCLPSANRHVLQQREHPHQYLVRSLSRCLRLGKHAKCHHSHVACCRLPAADAVTVSASARCPCPSATQSVVAPCFKTAHVCQIKWVVSADKPRELSELRAAGRVEEPTETLPRRCRLLSVSLRKFCWCRTPSYSWHHCADKSNK